MPSLYGLLRQYLSMSVRQYVSQFVSVFTRRRARSYDVPTPLLLSPLDCWQNSTPFFGMYALCRMKIGDFRFLFTDPPSPGVKV